MATTYKLVYFEVRGRAQLTRYLLEDNKIPYEYEAIDFENWEAYKPTTTFGQLPVLHDGDFELAQSHSIARYLAGKHGLHGDNEKDTARINMVYDGVADLFTTWATNMWLSDEEYKKKDVVFLKNLPDQLQIYEKLLSKNKEGKAFFVGDKISLADYAVFDICEIMNRYTPGCLDKCPLLKAFFGRMQSRDGIKAYLARDDIKKMMTTGSGKF